MVKENEPLVSIANCNFKSRFLCSTAFDTDQYKSVRFCLNPKHWEVSCLTARMNCVLISLNILHGTPYRKITSSTKKRAQFSAVAASRGKSSMHWFASITNPW